MSQIIISREIYRTLARDIVSGAVADPVLALAGQGIRLEMLSPLNPTVDRVRLRDVIAPFVTVLQKQNALPGQKASMSPGEVKSADVWVEEFLHKPDARTAAVLFEMSTGRCMTGAIGPALFGEKNSDRWMANVLEYGGTALHDFGQGTGLGTLVAAIFCHEARKHAQRLGHEFVGVLVESVTSAGKFWNSIGAKGLFRRVVSQGEWILEAVSYAMPQLPGEDGLQPDTGMPPEGEPDFWRERITLIPGQPGMRHVTGRLYKSVVQAFYESSYRPQRADFQGDRIAHAAALSYYLRTLQEVCIGHLADTDIIELYSDEEIQASGMPTFVWQKEEGEHRLGVDRAGCTGELIPYVPWQP
ncbi:MAG: cytochrome c [Magnetococcus sp. MYC-9]